jgi:hypothetical protein
MAVVGLIQLNFLDSHFSKAQVKILRNFVNLSSMCCGVILQDIIRAFSYYNKLAHDIDILITFCYFLDARALIIKAGLDPFNVINR